MVARAAPDGHTLAMVGTGFVISSLSQKTNYHPLTSFEPICQLFDSPMAVVVASDIAIDHRLSADLERGSKQARTIDARKHRSRIDGASRLRAVQARCQSRHHGFVPYPGTSPAVDAVMGEHVTAYIGQNPHFGNHRSRQVRRVHWLRFRPSVSNLLPDLPTLAERGFANITSELWWRVLGPPKRRRRLSTTSPASTARRCRRRL